MFNKRLISYIKKYRSNLILGVIALILADILGLMIPWIIKHPIDLLSNKSEKSLSPYVFSIISIVLFQSVFRFFWRRYIYGFSRKVEFHLRNDFFSHLQSLSWSFFFKNKVGDLMSRATNDIKTIREFCGLGILILIDASITITVSIFMMLFIDVKLTFIALLPLPIVTYGIFKMRFEIRKRFKKVQEKLANMSAMVQETFSAIRVVQAFVQEVNNLNFFQRQGKDIIIKNLESAKISALFFPLLLCAISTSSALTLLFGGKAVIENNITLGSFVAFNGYLVMLTWPSAALGLMINISQRGIAALDRIEAIMSLSPDVKNSKGVLNIDEISGDIEFSNIEFNYSNKLESDEFMILNIPDLIIKKGNLSVIVGSIGSGKSTLLRLIPRIFDNYSGKVSIGGIDIKDAPLNILRKSIGFVEQDPFLFSDTILENITFGLENVNFEEIKKVLKLTEIEEEINNFPKKIETFVGERGVTLSGGQKQRIGLARAILRNPEILILDDSFSSLDIETENKIMNNIKSMMRNTTILFATHRISTIKDADMIIVLNKGNIVEKGKHSTLLRKKGNYYNITTLQSYGLEWS